MMHARRILVLLFVLGLAWHGLGFSAAGADTGVDLSSPVPSTPEVVGVTDTPVPAMTATPLPLPTLQQEQESPTQTPPPSTTAPVEEVPTTTSTPVAVVQVPEQRPSPIPPTASPIPAPTSPPGASQSGVGAETAPLPSAADLEQNARLRWGDHIPAAVRRWAFLIVPAARTYGISPNLIAAVMTMESGGDPLAQSPADARGLMQILHGPWDPHTNVFAGARMLADLYGEFQDWSLALAAYNAGPNAVIAYQGVPPYRETRDYVIIVRYLWDLYQHHRLTEQRKKQYHSTLKDLQHYADQRKKVPKLAHIGQVQDDFNPAAPPPSQACFHFSHSCGASSTQRLFPTLDPFWPLGDVPDPLQQVDPYHANS